jgi:hypothetical protein
LFLKVTSPVVCLHFLTSFRPWVLYLQKIQDIYDQGHERGPKTVFGCQTFLQLCQHFNKSHEYLFYCFIWTTTTFFIMNDIKSTVSPFLIVLYNHLHHKEMDKIINKSVTFLHLGCTRVNICSLFLFSMQVSYINWLKRVGFDLWEQETDMDNKTLIWEMPQKGSKKHTNI